MEGGGILVKRFLKDPQDDEGREHHKNGNKLKFMQFLPFVFNFLKNIWSLVSLFM